MKKEFSIKDGAKASVYELVQMFTWGLAVGDETSDVIIWLDKEEQGHTLLTCKEAKEEDLKDVPVDALHLPLEKLVRINRNGRLVPNKGAIKELINKWNYSR